MNKRIIRYQLIETVESVRSLPEAGTHEYSNRVDDLISDLRDVKLTLRSGKYRHKYRKESGNLQRAIEALRYLKKQSDKIIKAENEKIDRLVEALDTSYSSSVINIAQCNVPATLDALGINNEEIKKAMASALENMIPFYLCDVTTAAAEIASKYFIKAVKKFREIIEYVYVKLIPERLDLYKGKSEITKKFECFNIDLLSASSGNKEIIIAAEKFKEKIDTNLKRIEKLDSTGIVTGSSILNILFDRKINNNPKVAALTSELNAILREEIAKKTEANPEDPEQTIKSAQLVNDFKNGAINIIKEYYEKEYPVGSYPRISN